MGTDSTVTSYRRIAQITRVKGLAGVVVAAPTVALPASAWEGLRLWVVPPDHDLIRETRVRSVAGQGAGSAPALASALALELEGVTSRAQAQRLQGRFLLACADDCDAEKDGPDVKESLVGWAVTDESWGLLGTITEERHGFAQTLWVVDGPFGELLIPAVEEFICARGVRAVTVSVPHGLLELNR